MAVVIDTADFGDPSLHHFLQAHLDELATTGPAESQHALSLNDLRESNARLWTAQNDGLIVAMVGLAAISAQHEELKSMRTDPATRGLGIGLLILEHALNDARGRGVRRVSPETGSADFFAPARRLYRRAGFTECSAFGNYPAEDPNSTFLTIRL